TLFNSTDTGLRDLEAKAAALAKHPHTMTEKEMHTFLGARFLASEYSTGNTHQGRIDSLGLDENGCPVIIEYKRHTNENVINQGLFYLDWLLDHKAEFELLVMKQLGNEASDGIEWSGTRLLCIAEDYTKYDVHAVQQINRNIELLRYKLFDKDLLLLELANVVSAGTNDSQATKGNETTASTKDDKTHLERVADCSPKLRALYDEIKSYALSLGDEVQEKTLKHYIAFRTIKNFLCADVLPKKDPKITIWLKLDPQEFVNEENKKFFRDVTNIGHFGTGNLEVHIRTQADLEKAKPLIERSFKEN
ncbi:MAG: DUF91 domain-containing protein, partial [Gammaproteobacteria bacterium]|nr:DUF91 domain-containing protein [Gammaproteobacteria bacterium]